MASSLALKRLASSSNLLCRSLRPAYAAAQPASPLRRFITNAVREYDRDERDDRDSDVDRRRVFSPFAFADMLSPFPTRSSLSQILNMMDQPQVNRRDWDVRETGDGLHLRVDMPGLGKEDVKVSVEQGRLTIKGEAKRESDEDDDGGRRYSSRIDLPEKLYKTNEIKAEMKNGVLKVFVPKIKEEERNDVFHVNID